ncbi:hypothetical protein OGATHE_003779 [Ogataea polymorpha]|uniref:Uncharacterized protein n=1 Tax=Ogataea polymorpha TaxID=460523 RepID=A0A9P8P598_9ASCO|nr:hypothetical protein OGATHE_003779 [Ogataea polymorpha]
MTASDELVIVQRKNRVAGVEEFRVEDDFHAILAGVEQMALADLVEDRVVCVIHHVVGHNWRQRVSFQRKHASLQVDSVCRLEQIVQRGQLDLRRVLHVNRLLAELEEPLAHKGLDVLDGGFQLLDHRLATQRVHGVRLGGCGHDDEGDHVHLGIDRLEPVVESGQCLDEEVHPFVSILVSSCNEKIESVLQLEAELSVEVAADELVDLLLFLCMEVLELVHRLEFHHVQPVGQHAIRLPF